MNPQQRLLSGQQAAQEGRYAEALSAYVWFHNNALKHEPALYGVRLSFALGYWLDLGRSYPKAVEKLREIRDKKVLAILKVRGDRDLFHDVASINRELDESQETCDLFQQLHRQHPDFAQQCVSLAMDALVDCKAYTLAHQYSPDPEGKLLRLSDDLADDIARNLQRPEEHRMRIQEAILHRYCQQVQSIAAILAGVSQVENSSYALEWGVALVEEPADRRKVGDILLGGKQSPLARHR